MSQYRANRERERHRERERGIERERKGKGWFLPEGLLGLDTDTLFALPPPPPPPPPLLLSVCPVTSKEHVI